MWAKLKQRLFDDDSSTGYEEVSEKRTTKTGYFLLFVMFLFLVGVGQTVFDDLNDLVTYPANSSECVTRLTVPSLPYHSHSPSSICRFTEIDTRFGLDTKYNAARPTLDDISSINVNISSYQYKINNAQRTITIAERQYELSLQEKIAEEEVLFDRGGQQSTISTQRDSIRNAQTNISRLMKERDLLVQNITPQVQAIEVSYKEAKDHYLTQRAWYKFKVFGLMLLFVLPFFVFSTHWYLKAKRKDSPYAIISTAVMAASVILLLQVMLMFLYQILPMQWLGRIFEWFLDIPALRFIIYYGGVALVVSIFGGIVYFIQRRVFNPKRVALRRLKKHECPKCSYIIHRDDKFCPSCSVQLKKSCSACGHDRSTHLRYCVNCGSEEAIDERELES
ncbi:MAG: RNA polymerase subunit RPABC4/transcription elongation factor Spt4 [Candidatus Paceibacteria bacterium]|jgi:RNA polymerase subunit RPABC4/transcription elongation factor Spt4